MSFQAQNMLRRRFQLLPHGDIVFRFVFGRGRVKNITGIANGTFTNLFILYPNASIATGAMFSTKVQASKNAKFTSTLRVAGNAGQILSVTHCRSSWL